MRLDSDNRLSNPYNLGGDPMPITGELVIDYKNDNNTPLHKILEAHPKREESSNQLQKSLFGK